MTKAQQRVIKELFENENKYLSMAGEKKDEIKSSYESLHYEYGEYSSAVMSTALAAVGAQKAYKEHKIDPYIAGGAAHGAAGLGAGIYTAIGAEKRNQEIDDRRAYYDKEFAKSKTVSDESESWLLWKLKKLEDKLNSVQEIKEYREKAVEEIYQNAKKQIKSNPYAARDLFLSLGDYKDSEQLAEESKSESNTASAIGVLVISAIFSLFIGIFGLAGGLTGYIMIFFSSFLVCCVMFGIMAFKSTHHS